MIEKLQGVCNAEIYASSLVEAAEGTFFLARRGTDKLVGCVGKPCLPEVHRVGEVDGRCVCLGEPSHENARALRELLPWAGPQTIGLATSVGLGDRLGLATPGHIRAVRGTGLRAFLAQQSIREMHRTGRTPDEVMDAATWGVLQEGFRDGFGSDADHLQKTEDIDATYKAGFTMFTIDPGAHTVNEADTLEPDDLQRRFASLDFQTLDLSGDQIQALYVGQQFRLGDGSLIQFDAETFLRAAVKYGQAIAHTVRMYRHLESIATRDFEVEVSVDETDSPTSVAEHYYFAAELRRLGVEWVSMAPRFIGRFEKGVDYLGDVEAFGKSFAQHVAVMRALGPYKMSIHSGSDKFTIYPIVAELTDGLVHLKTAGTSYLEALRSIASIDPGLYREILDFARQRYEEDKKTYHVSADVGKVPAAEDLSDAAMADLMDQFDARQVFHVTFGSVLTTDRGERFGRRIYDALRREEQTHYAALSHHLGRHVSPFVRYDD